MRDCTLAFGFYWDTSVPWQTGLTFPLKTSCEGEGTLVGSSMGLGLTQRPCSHGDVLSPWLSSRRSDSKAAS